MDSYGGGRDGPRGSGGGRVGSHSVENFSRGGGDFNERDNFSERGGSERNRGYNRDHYGERGSGGPGGPSPGGFNRGDNYGGGANSERGGGFNNRGGGPGSEYSVSSRQFSDTRGRGVDEDTGGGLGDYIDS